MMLDINEAEAATRKEQLTITTMPIDAFVCRNQRHRGDPLSTVKPDHETRDNRHAILVRLNKRV